jgi:hypothetical protein
MRRYEWVFIGCLIGTGLLCLVTAGAVAGWPGADPNSGLGRLSEWLMVWMPYLMGACFLLWAWAVWGLVSGYVRNRQQKPCRSCGRPAESDWIRCPYCGTELQERSPRQIKSRK